MIWSCSTTVCRLAAGSEASTSASTLRGKDSLIWLIMRPSQGLRAASWIVVWISSLASVVGAVAPTG